MDNTTKFWERKTFALLITGVLASIAFLLLAQAYAALKAARFIGQDVQFSTTISVSGIGEYAAAPDIAEVSFAVVKEAQTVADAQAQVTEIMNGVLVYVQDEAGVAEKDIATTNYSIAPKYEYRRDGAADLSYPWPGNQVIAGYTVSHWVTVKVRDLAATGSLVGELGARGATNVSDVNFTFDKPDAVKDKARELAIKDAKEKAAVLARDLGVILVKVVNFSEYGGGPIPYRTFSAFEGAKLDAAVAPEIPVGENTVTSNVTITYAIE